MKRVDGVVLAAGPSRRLRTAASRLPDGDLPKIKQLLRFGAESLVRRAARAALASRLARVVVVVGCEADAVAAELTGLQVTVVDNPRFADGQSTSVIAALDHLDARAEAALFIPCDQPFLGPETLDRVLETRVRTGKDIVVPTSGGERRAPVLIARPLFDDLRQITGDSGARQLFAAHAGAIAEVEIDDPRALRDVDTPEDYRRLLLQLG